MDLKKEFWYFLKKTMMVMFIFAMVVAIFTFIFSIFDSSVEANIGSIHLNGIKAGIAALFIIPIFGLIFGIPFGVAYFFPYLLVKKFIRKYII